MLLQHKRERKTVAFGVPQIALQWAKASRTIWTKPSLVV